jgi:hypothetical protein
MRPAIFHHPDRPPARWEVEGFVNCYRALGRCVVEADTGMLRPDWAAALMYATGWAWSDISNRLLVQGITERIGPGEPGNIVGPDGRARRERLTEAGQALVWMARVAAGEVEIMGGPLETMVGGFR